MRSESKRRVAGNVLLEMEMEVETEGREWVRRRLQEKLHAHADREGGVFPLKRFAGVASAHPHDATQYRFR